MIQILGINNPVYIYNDNFECIITIDKALSEMPAEDCDSGTTTSNVEGNDPVENADAKTVFASQNGEKYYFKDCSTLSRILPENLISFSSAAEAEEAGYEPSSCVLDAGEN